MLRVERRELTESLSLILRGFLRDNNSLESLKAYGNVRPN